MFLGQWQKITNDQTILHIISGWEIPFVNKPPQMTAKSCIVSKGEEKIVEQEIKKLISKGAIEQTKFVKGQVLSSLFLREKKDGSQRPILNLRNLNKHIPYLHFKMESLKSVKDLMKKDDWMIKIDLKDAYFTVPLGEDSRKFVRFPWKGKLYQFLCLCFGLGPAPRLFTKLLKVPISLLRRIMIRLVIFLDDLLVFGSSEEEILEARDSVLYVLENLGFIISQYFNPHEPWNIWE